MGRTKSMASLEDCNDRVYRIVNTPIYTTANPAGYKTMLVQTDEEDLKEALEILRRADIQSKKQEEIEIELEIRRKPEQTLKGGNWEKMFCKEWEGVREAAKRRRCR